MSKKFYAYYVENKKGITDSWDKCKEIVDKKFAKYKSFKTKEEAQYWLDNGFKLKELPIGIYFDAGTGGKIGVEVKVADEKGNNLLSKILPAEKINKNGNYSSPESTNNFGELLGCYFALNIAFKEDIKNVYGDSNLIIEFWSQGKIKKDVLPQKTVLLAEEVRKLRKEFEAKGGKLEHISGDRNPADLGYHK